MVHQEKSSCVHKKYDNISGELYHPKGKVVVCKWLIHSDIPQAYVQFVLLHSSSSMPWDRVSFYYDSIFTNPIYILSLGGKIDRLPTDKKGNLIILSSHTDPSLNFSSSSTTISYKILQDCIYNCSSTFPLCSSEYLPCNNDTSLTKKKWFNSMQEMSSGIFHTNLSSSLNLPEPSSQHASVLVNNSYIYIHGGYPNKMSGSLIRRYSIVTNQWSDVKMEDDGHLPCLYQHTMNYWNIGNALVIFGGLHCTNHTLSYDMYIIYLDNRLVKLSLPLTNSFSKVNMRDIFEKSSLAFAVFGHQAHILSDNILFIFFGMDSNHQLSPVIQRINLSYIEMWGDDGVKASLEWPSVGPAPSLGLLQVSSVMDMINECIWFHGGLTTISYSSNFSIKMATSPALYSFHWRTKKWIFRGDASIGRMGHSMILVPHLNRLLIMGGCSLNQRFNCEINVVNIYHISSQQWQSMRVAADENGYLIERYGPSLHLIWTNITSISSRSLALFGGFRRRIFSETTFLRLDCETALTQRTCSSPILNCIWIEATNKCTAITQERFQEIQRPMPRLCESYGTSCTTCLLNFNDGCSWCPDEKQCRLTNETNSSSDGCISLIPELISNYSHVLSTCLSVNNSSVCDQSSMRSLTCSACLSTGSSCQWNMVTGTCHSKTSNVTSSSFIQGSESNCPPSCSEFERCDACVSGTRGRTCVWCASQSMCYEWSSMLATNVMGQCQQIITGLPARCGAPQAKTRPCLSQHTCHDCASLPECGWCEYSNFSGAGKCYPGGVEGPLSSSKVHLPLKYNSSLCGNRNTLISSNSSFNTTWHYVAQQCPTCQCHGFGHCDVKTEQIANLSSSGLPACQCFNHTRGSTCEQCEIGYYGKPSLGLECLKCDCVDNVSVAYNCSSTGSCQDFCLQAGAFGHSCEMCHPPMKLMWGSCYYEMIQNHEVTLQVGKGFLRSTARFFHVLFVPRRNEDALIEVSCEPHEGTLLNYSFIPTGMNVTDVSSTPQPKLFECNRFDIRLSSHEYLSLVNATFIIRITRSSIDPSSHMVITMRFTSDEHGNYYLISFLFAGGILLVTFIIMLLWRFILHYWYYRRVELHGWRLTQRALATVDFVMPSEGSDEDDAIWKNEAEKPFNFVNSYSTVVPSNSKATGRRSKHSDDKMLIANHYRRLTESLTGLQPFQIHRPNLGRPMPFVRKPEERSALMSVLLRLPPMDEKESGAGHRLAFGTAHIRLHQSDLDEFQQQCVTSTDSHDSSVDVQTRRRLRLMALRRAAQATLTHGRN